LDKTTYHRSKKNQKESKGEELIWELSEEQGEEQFDPSFVKPRKLSVKTERDPVEECTNYSQKLGTAIFEMFK
jgi:hypothetical protein